MSSGSSSRFQSKLFNFVSQQSRRLIKKWENAFQNLQVLTRWNVETLLSPIFQLWNQDESGRNLLPSSQAKPVPADLPIQHLLEIVENLPTGVIIKEPTPLSLNPVRFATVTVKKVAAQMLGWLKVGDNPPANTLQQHIPIIRGIATDLATGNLVLVSADNRILDVLTSEQQRQLLQRIHSEITEYEPFLELTPARKARELLPEIEQILTKLTGDSLMTNQTQLLSFLNPDKIIVLLDLAIAKLEVNTFIKIPQLNIFREIQELKNPSGKVKLQNDCLENPGMNIPALIEAAINYFFGARIRSNIKASIDQQIGSKPLPTNQPDNWLIWSDLFGNIGVKSPEKTPVDSSPRIEQGKFYQNYQLQEKPDWIETDAKFLGYEQHPLELVLRWLDSTLLWLEELFLNIFYFCKGLLGGK